MAFSYPGYVVPKPGDFLGELARGYQFGQGVQNDIADQQGLSALAGYASQLRQPSAQPQAVLAQPQPPQPPQPVAPFDANGHPTTVGDRAQQLRDSMATADYFSNIANAESGGDPNAKSSTSSASGLYQITAPTWQGLMQNHPELGLTADGVNDPGQQQAAVQALTTDNARALASNGVAPSPGALYTAHMLGAPVASKVLTASADAPLASVIPQQDIAANPTWANMSVGDFVNAAQQRATNGQGGYSPPMGNSAVGGPSLMNVGGIPQGAGLPDRNTLLTLLRAPATRQFAGQMIATAQKGQDPSALLDLALKKAQIDYYGARSDAANTKASGTGAGGVDPSQVAQIGDAMIKGDQPPVTTGLYRYAAPLKAYLASKGFNLSQANEDWTATQKHLASLNGTQQLRLRQAVDFASQSLNLVDDLADQWKGGQFPLLNKANLAAAKQGLYGQPAASLATRLSSAIADLTSELGTVYKGGNSSTDESLRLAASNLSEDWSTDTIRDATGQIRKSLTYRQNSLRNVPVSGVPDSRYDPTETVGPEGEQGGQVLTYNPATGELE